jgi:hypothetical protein
MAGLWLDVPPMVMMITGRGSCVSRGWSDRMDRLYSVQIRRCSSNTPAFLVARFASIHRFSGLITSECVLLCFSSIDRLGLDTKRVPRVRKKRFCVVAAGRPFLFQPHGLEKHEVEEWPRTDF